MTPGVAMAENIKRVIERAKQAGMTAEDTFTLFGREVTLADAIQTAGLDLHEFFDNGYKDSGDEVVEFVRSMFDEEGNTPKGPTGVLISVEKKFGEEAVYKAEQVMSELMSQAEVKRIQELSGLGEGGHIPGTKPYQPRVLPNTSSNQGSNPKPSTPTNQQSSTDRQSKIVNTKDDFEEGIEAMLRIAGIK